MFPFALSEGMKFIARSSEYGNLIDIDDIVRHMCVYCECVVCVACFVSDA